MLQNVEYTNKPELYIYERANGMAHITLADNIREGVNANEEDCWYCDLYMMVLPDSDNMAQRIERSYEVFLAKAKADEADKKRAEANSEPTAAERIHQLEEQNTMLLECLLEMSEIVYA